VLEIPITLEESFNEDTGEYLVTKSFVLEFEHSLASLSKWESKYEKTFLGTEKSDEEVSFYIEKCMLQSKNPPGDFLQKLSKTHIQALQDYIDAKMSATTIKNTNRPASRQIITSEVMYGWLVGLRIPIDMEHWHLNRFLMLVQVINEQQKQPAKMGRGEAARQQAALNEQRRAALGTRG
jgi:hypothetical protein